jgi:GT2 family glycosyltransferase
MNSIDLTAMPMPVTSIIIVSHNGLRQTTAPCLESIFRNDARGDFEVIVVDNNSSDDTPVYLADTMEREPRLRCVFNESNRGFAGGNNDGLKIASGSLLILLNSDCIVTKNWIEGLNASLLEDPAIGLVGPVSNSVGNEQRIFTSGVTPEEIIAEGMAWVSNSRGARFETEMLSFFCVALRRDVLDRVGMLDETFGLGFYEDDDYCMRARHAGYKLICAEDVFVYHRGGGSFGRFAQGTRKIMKENRRKLETKYSCRFERTHPRQRQLRVIEGYSGELSRSRADFPTHESSGSSNQGVQYRISNRIKAIESQMPRGIFKKWAFKRRLGRLKELLARNGHKF